MRFIMPPTIQVRINENWVIIVKNPIKSSMLDDWSSAMMVLRCVHTMPRGRMRHTAALPHDKSCSAYAANAIVSTWKKNFWQTFFRLQNLWNRLVNFVWFFFSQTGWYVAGFKSGPKDNIWRGAPFWSKKHHSTCSDGRDASNNYEMDGCWKYFILLYLIPFR